MPRLSIIIPVWGNLPLLEDTLVSVLQNRPARCEIVVVLDEPYDDPYGLTDELRFVPARSSAGLAAGVNLGLAATESPIVHVLHAGTAVHERWTEAALRRFEDPLVAVVAPLLVQMDAPQRVVAAGVAYHRGGSILPLGSGYDRTSVLRQRTVLDGRICGPHFAAGFYRRSALELVGRFSEAVGDRLAALDAAMSMAHAGLRTVLEPDCRVRTADLETLRGGVFRQALDAERFYWRWAPRGGWARSLAAHAIALAGESLRHAPRPAMFAGWAGRIRGVLEFGSHQHHAEHLDRCRRIVQAISPAAEDGQLHADPTELLLPRRQAA